MPALRRESDAKLQIAFRRQPRRNVGEGEVIGPGDPIVRASVAIRIGQINLPELNLLWAAACRTRGTPCLVQFQDHDPECFHAVVPAIEQLDEDLDLRFS